MSDEHLHDRLRTLVDVWSLSPGVAAQVALVGNETMVSALESLTDVQIQTLNLAWQERCQLSDPMSDRAADAIAALVYEDRRLRETEPERQEWVGPVAPGSDIPPLRLSVAYDGQGRAMLDEAALAQLLLDAGWERTA